jgi:hypothetical protein
MYEAMFKGSFWEKDSKCKQNLHSGNFLKTATSRSFYVFDFYLGHEGSSKSEI